MSTARARTLHAEAILGPELHPRLRDTKVLLVGAGGIGCELCECSEYFPYGGCGANTIFWCLVQ